MLHTYSLVHDDLPALDNDDLRRGRPTCHKAFGEATAILAGDALQTQAYEVMAQLKCPAEARVRIIAELAHGTGTIDGMIGGQVVDLESEHVKPDLPTTRIHPPRQDRCAHRQLSARPAATMPEPQPWRCSACVSLAAPPDWPSRSPMTFST